MSVAPFIIAGIVAGSLYGLAATGLVLSYKTSGIFNLAHGAVGSGAAFLFYELTGNGVRTVPALLVVLVVAAPLAGALLSTLAGALEQAATAQRVVATIGVLLVIQGVIQLRYGIAPVNVDSPLPSTTFRIFDINVGYDQLITTVVSALGIGALAGLFRYTRLGLQMRAVVDAPDLLDLAQQPPAVVRMKAWVIGSVFAALSGILLAPTIGLDALVLTLVVVQAFGAAAVGRFDSIPRTYLAGVAIGVTQSILGAPTVRDALPFLDSLPGIEQTIPFLVLLIVLLAVKPGSIPERAPRRRPRPLSEPPVPLRVLVAAVAVAGAIAAPYVAPTRVPVFTAGAVFLTIFASLFLLVEISNQVSLCHVAFVAIGATTFCHLTTGAGLPWLAGAAGAVIVVGLVGAIVAIPAIRVSGLLLALATFGFGILVERMFYNRGVLFGRYGSRLGSRPDIGAVSGDRGYFLFCLAIGVVSIGVVLLIRRSQLGRLLAGLADSPIAMVTHGASTNVTRLLVFVISSMLAGLGGVLYVGIVGSVASSGTSTTSLVSFNSLMWLAVLAFVGRGAISAPVIACLVLVVGPSFNTNPNAGQQLTILFGIVAVLVAARGDVIAERMESIASRVQPRHHRSPVAARATGAAHG